jgi:hypothetical protein
MVSPGGLRAIERDRRELSEELRALHAVRGGEEWEEVLRRFLHELPDSPLRSRFVREQFRAAMSTRYPVPGGTEICGTVILDGPGTQAQAVPPCVIHLDHFAVASSDRSGSFVARGIPPVDDPLSVPLRIANRDVLSTSPVAVHLPRLQAVLIDVDLRIVLRTAPEGTESRAPSREEPSVGDSDLDDLQEMVDQL